jgi:hypothetical protein
MIKNKITTVTFTGGIIGLFLGSPQKTIQNNQYGAYGWMACCANYSI